MPAVQTALRSWSIYRKSNPVATAPGSVLVDPQCTILAQSSLSLCGNLFSCLTPQALEWLVRYIVRGGNLNESETASDL